MKKILQKTLSKLGDWLIVGVIVGALIGIIVILFALERMRFCI